MHFSCTWMHGLDGMETSSKSIAIFDVLFLISLVTLGGCVFAHGVADGELLHVPLLLAGCSHAGTGHQSSINPIIMANILWSLLLFHRSKLERLICKLIFQVIIPMDDDVTVLNRPVETKYYSPPPDHVHTEVNLWLYLYLMSIHYHMYYMLL